MGQAALDQLVLSYLSKRKCTNALQAFKEESQAASSSRDMALAPQLSKEKGIVEDLLFYLVAENDTQQYLVAFDRLTAWVDNSLDAYQAELARVLYPVFIHCYLHLIEKEATEAAAQLMGKHKKRFSEVDGANSRTRMQELNELQTVAAPEHLKTYRIAQTVQSNRFPVRLSAYSFELLAAFLTSAKPLALLLAIINEHLSVRIVDGSPAGMDQEEPDALELLTGHMPEDVTTKNQAPLNLALLQDSIEVKAAEADAPTAEGAGKRKGKRPREEEGGKKSAREDPQALVEATDPEVPVVGISRKLEALLVKDFTSRARLNKDALPSAILFTFLNTHHSLNCVSFAADGSVVAGGFADSSIRVHNVAKAKAAGKNSSAGPAHGTTFLRGHTGAVFAAAFTLDRQMLLSASADGTVRLWSTEAAANLAVYRGHNLAVWDVAASSHGYFASASADRTARVWVSERALPLRLLAGHYTDVDVVRWHPSGHFLGTGSSDRTVRLWDLREGQSRRILTGHKAPITSMGFSPEGNLAASGDENGDVIMWDLRQAARLEAVKGHTAAVWSLAFSQPDGALLASGGGDNAIKLYACNSAAPGAKKSDQQGLTYSDCKKLRTKATPVLNVTFTHRNLLLAGGGLVPPAEKTALL